MSTPPVLICAILCTCHHIRIELSSVFGLIEISQCEGSQTNWPRPVISRRGRVRCDVARYSYNLQFFFGVSKRTAATPLLWHTNAGKLNLGRACNVRSRYEASAHSLIPPLCLLVLVILDVPLVSASGNLAWSSP